MLQRYQRERECFPRTSRGRGVGRERWWWGGGRGGGLHRESLQLSKQRDWSRRHPCRFWVRHCRATLWLGHAVSFSLALPPSLFFALDVFQIARFPCNAKHARSHSWRWNRTLPNHPGHYIPCGTVCFEAFEDAMLSAENIKRHSAPSVEKKITNINHDFFLWRYC